MRLQFLKVFSIVLFWGMLIISCQKDDPALLGAQKNAIFLAGDKGKSKIWKLRELSIQPGTGAAQTITLEGCFADNIYTFTNNDAQDYAATEGTSKCYTPDAIESGTWAFTLDGLILNVQVDDTQSPNGIFSPEIIFFSDTTFVQGGWTPNPGFVKEINANKLVLEVNRKVLSSSYKYTLTFTP